MEVHLRGGHAVGLGLGGGQDLKRAPGQRAGAGRHVNGVKNLQHVSIRAVRVRVRMFMRVAALGAFAITIKVVHVMVMAVNGGVKLNVKAARVKAGALHAAHVRLKAVKRHAGQRAVKRCAAGAQVKQRGHGHVAGHAALAIKV
jgi:hypothetical protein